MSKLIFDKGSPGRRSFRLPKLDVPRKNLENHIPDNLFREELALPEISELELVRHYTRLSQKNMAVDTAFYPLGSCTMKYNPRVNERIAGSGRFAGLHPYLPEKACQGMLAILYETETVLCEICGMDAFTLQPAAGAHGELTGLLLIRAYHKFVAGKDRINILVMDSAHGTNPASAAVAGFQVSQVKSNTRGMIDLDDLARQMDDDVAALMLTNPNTLGVFEKDIVQAADIVHSRGGLLYYDGANMNAFLGITRPGDMGFDVVHVNLHKSFSTPHGGGGPGSGPVGVKAKLKRFLPVPRIEKSGDDYILDDDRPLAIGRVRSFYGNTGVIVKALAYIRALGSEGLTDVARFAVLNANYLMHLIEEKYDIPYKDSVLHEFVISARRHKMRGAKAVDIAKALLDKGFHAPTVYFPLIVEEAMMIEPTETESKQELDAFAQALLDIDQDTIVDCKKITSAPVAQPVKRLDEVTAARKPNLAWKPKNDDQ